MQTPLDRQIEADNDFETFHHAGLFDAPKVEGYLPVR